MMGDNVVVMDKNSNIYVDNVKHKGTPVLWILLMLKYPAPYAYT